MRSQWRLEAQPMAARSAACHRSGMGGGVGQFMKLIIALFDIKYAVALICIKYAVALFVIKYAVALFVLNTALH